MDVIMENLLPRRPTIGLSDIQAEQTQPLAQQMSNSVDGSHHSLGFVFRERPDIFGMVPRDNKCVTLSYLTVVEKGNSALVLV